MVVSSSLGSASSAKFYGVLDRTRSEINLVCGSISLCFVRKCKWARELIPFFWMFANIVAQGGQNSAAEFVNFCNTRRIVFLF